MFPLTEQVLVLWALEPGSIRRAPNLDIVTNNGYLINIDSDINYWLLLNEMHKIELDQFCFDSAKDSILPELIFWNNLFCILMRTFLCLQVMMIENSVDML